MLIPDFIPDENIKIFDKQNKILITYGKQFIIDCCKTLFFNVKNYENYETTIFELYGDKRNITNFYKSIINDFKELYLLSNDLYDFRNDFFEIKNKTKNFTKSNKKGKNLILKEITVFRNYDNLLLNFNFIVQFNIGNKFINKPIIISLIVGVFNKNQFHIDKTNIIDLRDNYIFDNIDNQITLLTEIKSKQEEYRNFIRENESKLLALNKNVFIEISNEPDLILKR